MEIRACTREEFVAAITQVKEDKFAKSYFLPKADMMNKWECCWGAFEGKELMGAILQTYTLRSPKTANLQLVHTFAAHRKKGVGAALCEFAVGHAHKMQAKYFRVSANKTAIEFYSKIGFKFWGRQKSGCQLSMFQIGGPKITDGIYDFSDFVIYNAVHKKGQGGCVEVFVKRETPLEGFFE